MPSTTPTQEERDAAARAFLKDDDVESSQWSDTTYDVGGNEWVILTDEEANDLAEESIRESVWAFVPSFLVAYMPEGVTEEVIEPLQEKCEDANPAILGLIGDRFDDFASDAISSDGRGHFLSGYDGEEHEFEHDGRYWYAYRN